MEQNHRRDVWLLLAIVVVTAVLASGLRERRDRAGDLQACVNNLKSLSSAMELYAVDHFGRFPGCRSLDPTAPPNVRATFLQRLTPHYIASIPTCPAAGLDTYSVSYREHSCADSYELYCKSDVHDHVDYPRCDSRNGLAVEPPDNLASSLPAEPILVQSVLVDGLRPGMTHEEALAASAQCGRTLTDWVDTQTRGFADPYKVYHDTENRLCSVAGETLTVNGRNLAKGDSRGRVEALVGTPWRINHFKDGAWTHTGPAPVVHEYEYHAANGELIVGFDEAKDDRVSYFILCRRTE